VTFGVRGGDGAARAQVQGLVVFGLGLGLTSGALALLHALDPTPARAVELLLLVAANAAATLLRFLLFRGWVFRTRAAAPHTETTTPAHGSPAALEMETAR
jgi:hypothetical protein